MLDVTDTTLTVQHPKTGAVKTIARARWYRPDGPPVKEQARPTKRVTLSQIDTNIGLGFWRTVTYDDGSGKAWLSERFDEPIQGELLPAQQEALAAYLKHGAKGVKWGPR